MLTIKTIRWSGVAAMLGGLLWIGAAAAIAARPVGCIADACALPGRSMRVWDDLGAVFAAALLLGLAGQAGLVLRAWTLGRFGRLGAAGLLLSAAGALSLVAAGLAQAFVFGGDFAYMPVVVIPAGLLLAAGVVLVGSVVWQARVLPRWVAWLFLASALLLLASNDQTARVLLWVPLGVAWVAAGYDLWSSSATGR